MGFSGNLSRSNNPTALASDLFSSGRYSDLTIKCQGRVFKVHRAIVCLQSKPLAAAIEGGFKVGSPNARAFQPSLNPEVSRVTSIDLRPYLCR